jgi:iron complex outermembrane receptor protein
MRRNATLFGLAALLLAFGFTPLAAQTVTGTVTDASTGEPLPFANIIVQGTQLGTATDIDGEYTLEVPGPDAVLVFRYIGYLAQELVVGDRTVIDVALEEDANLLDEVVVVGYGTQRRGDVTASVSTIEVDDANQGLVTAPTDFLEGRVAGLSVIEASGEPGANVDVRIRGGTSITSSNQPLYVIDGIPVGGDAVTPGGAGDVSTGPAPNPLTLINPNDIQNITVLKDASATAIYGSRGANGVILITTKQGREGQVSVDYEGSISTASPANSYDILSADELRTLVRDLENAAGNDGDAAVAALGDANTDFQDAILGTGVSQQHNLSFSGGTALAQFRASLSYLNQEGIAISSGLERVTGRLNANSQFLDNRLRLGLNLTSALTDNDFVPANATGGAEGGIFQNLIDFRPTLPVNAPNTADNFFELGGSFAPRNPVALAEQLDETARTTRTLGNVSAELDVYGGITANVNVGGDRSIGRRQGYFSRFSPVAEGDAINGMAFQRDLERTSITLQTYLTYDLEQRLESRHSLDLTGGFEYNDFDTQEFSLQGNGFISDVFGSNRINAAQDLVIDGGGIGPGSFSFRTGYKLASYFARANYGFNDRYYLTGVLRYDGSSRFSEDNRYALFPAVSAAWRLSEEAFLEDVGFISDLRLRAGYGLVGNQGLSSDFLPLALLEANADLRAVLGGTVFTGVAPNQLANPDLKWEAKEEFVVGLDYGFLGGRLFGSLDVYRNTTNDLLLNVRIPSPAPVAFQVQNVGSIRNTGFELSLDAVPYQTDNSSFDLGITFSTNANEILDLGGRNQIFTGTVSGRGQSNQAALLLTPGQPYPVFYGAEFTGEFDDSGFPLYNDYEDTDNDGFNDQLVGTTTVPDQGDYQIIGDPRADFTYGIRMGFQIGGFSARAFLRGEQGRDLFNNTALVYSSLGNALSGFGRIDREFDADENPTAPAVYSDRFVENASFLRLDQVTLEYAIPTEIFGSAVGSTVRTARVFVTGNNLFVITPYSGIDPEVSANAERDGIFAFGIDYLPYPRARTFTVGVGFGL